MNMAISAYEYGRGGKCVYMLRYTYAANLRKEDADGKGGGHVGRIVRTSIGTMRLVSIKFVEKGTKEYRTEHKTVHATQVERHGQVEKKAQAHRNRQTDKECA